jgi:hypothetical protein
MVKSYFKIKVCAKYMNGKGPKLGALGRSVHFDASSLSFNMTVDRKSNRVTAIEVQFSK